MRRLDKSASDAGLPVPCPGGGKESVFIMQVGQEAQ
jgi:hypothetical protein